MNRFLELDCDNGFMYTVMLVCKGLIELGMCFYLLRSETGNKNKVSTFHVF